MIGLIQRANAKNQNGRIYPREILKKEIDRYINDFVKNDIAYGELDHEEDPVVKLKNASHKIKKIWWEGDEVMAEIKLLDTPGGRIAKAIAEDGPLGISSRAIGSVSKNEADGTDIVEEDLQLICFDIVGHPSTHNAFLKLKESSSAPRTKQVQEEVEQKTDTFNNLIKELLKK